MDAVVRKWLEMPRTELDHIFRAAPAGTPPQGEMEGTVIIGGTGFSYLLAVLVRALVWQGKVFDMAAPPHKGVLVNKITPFNISLVAAEVYRGDSWLDGREAIIIDYSKTSFIASKIRDEIREVEPGLFLGKVWCGHTRLFDFALARPGRERPMQ
jgi:hypothetical protein